jgi:hypothetical protein
MSDFGHLDPMGVDESSVIDRIATNKRITELEVMVATYKIKYEHAFEMAHDLGMTLRRRMHGPQVEAMRQAETVLRFYDEWCKTGLSRHYPEPK